MMWAWLAKMLNPRDHLPPEIPEDRASTARVVDALLSLERTSGRLTRELNAREEAYRRVVEHREGRRP